MPGCDEKFLHEPDARSGGRDSYDSKGSYESASPYDEKPFYSSNTSYDEKSSWQSTVSDDEKAVYNENSPPKWAYAFYNRLEDKPLPPLPVIPQMRPVGFASKSLPALLQETRPTKYAKKPKRTKGVEWWKQRRHQLSDVKHEDEALKSMREREMAAAMNDAVMAVRRGMERMGIP